ncbi:MAG: lamin tail domain-containing protein, partial [Candidatus Limnocylindria bacterium]
MAEPRPSLVPSFPTARPAFVTAVLCLIGGWLAAPVGALVVTGTLTAVEAAADQHLVVSEVMTGGAGAADELIEIYNPGPAELPLEGLEVVYVSATGTSPSRRAAWAAGAASVPPGAHVLIANEAGIFASIADAVYASGVAAAGGSIALRIQGASTALDAVGWGTAANAWMEGTAAPAPSAGSSIERLPGRTAGSTQDTDDNLADFALRAVPDPQNSTSPPTPDPGASPSPTPSASPAPTPTPPVSPTPVATLEESATPQPTSTPQPTPSTSDTPTPVPTPMPTPEPTASLPAPMPVADARALPDGATATIAGLALTSWDFTDGGGYVADASGGIAVLLTDGAFARGDLLVVSGTLDDRYAQRTLRTDAAGIVVAGSGVDPHPRQIATGEVSEPVEGQLVHVAGVIDGSPTPLSGAMAFDLDDGSGVARVVVATALGIDLGGWVSGARLDLVGVVGQRDSTGTGVSGYRVQPRAAADVLSLTPPTPEPSPTASHSPGATGSLGATPSPTGGASPPSTPLVAIAEARAAARNTRVRVRGIVTMGTGVEDPRSAIVQDASGAIVLRLSDEAGTLERGAQVEASGARSTYSGMETLRVTQPPVNLGTGPEPAANARSTGGVGEADEARLVVARGSVVATPRRASSGTLSFEIDDGTGALRIVIFAAVGTDPELLGVGAWIEVTGVVGQETSGSQPTRGYRIWPRDPGDVRLLAAAVAAEEQGRADDDAGDRL